MFDALDAPPPSELKAGSTSDLDAQVAHRAGRRRKAFSPEEARAIAERLAVTEHTARDRLVNPPPVGEHRRPVYDPEAAQAELEAATDRRLAAAMRAVQGTSRKADPEAYDKARAELADARTAYANVRIFTRL